MSTLTKRLAVIIGCILLVDLTSALFNEACFTPKHERGTCIQLEKCQNLISLLHEQNLSQLDRDFLAKSQCGYENKTVLICCQPQYQLIEQTPKVEQTSEVKQEPQVSPRMRIETETYGACLTPNKEHGTCMVLDQCAPLFGLLSKASITADDRNLLARSQCGYVNSKVLVCCPPQSISMATRSGPRGTLPVPPQCGIDLTDRILGGNITGIEEFPWMALIEYTKPGNTMGHHCGGTLINNRYIVTAAHCVKGRGIPADWRLTGVRLGEWDTTTNPDCDVDKRNQRHCVPPHIDVKVSQIIVHPNYNPASRNQLHDIALLRLESTVPNNSNIKPICLPKDENLKRETFTNTAMDVAGWGKTESTASSSIKLKALVNVWDLDNCRNSYKQHKINLENTQMCAGGQEGVDSCRGDSGGPLMVQSRIQNFDAFILAGVVSFGPTPCGLLNWPGVYTRVGAYVDWIQDNIDP